MGDSLANMAIGEVRKELSSRSVSVREVVESCLAAVKEQEETVGAYLEVFDDALQQADAAQTRIEAGDDVPLLGIPVAVKDNIVQKGRRASAGSRILGGFVSPYDATVITKLKEAGAIFLGRTNMDEFAMGSSTEHSAYKLTRNPHDQSRVPGGSSGGSAAAVSMGGALFALGSDTGGSIRQPASFCGVVGLKPTYGRVSRNGLMAMGSSLDVIGPLTRTVRDARLVFDVIQGKDNLDATSYDAKSSVDPVARIGVPRSFLQTGVDSDVMEAFERALSRFKERGIEVVDVDIPNVGIALATYYIIMPAEASTNLARYDGVKYGLHVSGESLLDDYVKTRGEGFGPEVRRRVLLGTYVLSAGYYDAFYRKAQHARGILAHEFAEAFRAVDVIATPTTPTPAFEVGSKKDPLSMYAQDIFTVPANIAGIPGISIPMGMAARGGVDLPVGLQLLAPHNEEERLFALGEQFLGD